MSAQKLDPKDPASPRKVFLFSGHMIDAPDRSVPRFPPDKEKIAGRAIAQKLDELDAGECDLALCSGACGGDLLFAEACLRNGLRLQLYLPFATPQFVERSVRFAGGAWVERFERVRHHAQTTLLILPDKVASVEPPLNPYQRNNLWMLDEAFQFGAAKVEFICLWDGLGGDVPGGTRHMVETVAKTSAHAHVIDTRRLFIGAAKPRPGKAV